MGSLFKNRIDLSYVADNGEYERHRAIKILRPTTELSGLYKCKVSSFVDEDFLTARMTVFGECAVPSNESPFLQQLTSPPPPCQQCSPF